MYIEKNINYNTKKRKGVVNITAKEKSYYFSRNFISLNFMQTSC